jgi:alpha,alpha-trehalose phosphorylase
MRPSGGDEPWAWCETGLDVARLGWSESIFALSNGHIGLRGNLDEGEPFGAPGTYLNSVYEEHPLPSAEAGYGFPESGQTVINVTNGKLLRLLVDDEPFDVRYGELRRHERRLDLRAGVLERELEWVSPAGQEVRVHSTRLVSFSQRAVAAIRYGVEAVGAPARVVVQSELVANEPEPPPRADDPRVAAPLIAPLMSVEHSTRAGTVVLVHRTRRSGIGVAAAMSHRVEGPPGTAEQCDSDGDLGRSTVTAVLEPGERLVIVKYLGYGWSTMRSEHALRDQVAAAVAAAEQTGWHGLLAEQRQFLDDFWGSADIEVGGDPELQRATRVALFHAVQSAARAEQRPIAAKGLTGNGYDGHTFWDMDTFVLPFLTHSIPQAAADVVRWRHRTLDEARLRARALGLRGATFPWRTIRGEECSGYWPAGTAAFHVNAAVAEAAVRVAHATGDEDFERSVGVELLVETARLWHSLGHYDGEGEFRIDGVTGPDEYSAVMDNNVYTNLMARRNLRAAADACHRHPDVAAALSAAPDEQVGWRSAAAAMRVPYDQRLGVHPQSEGFTDHERWDFEHTEHRSYPLLQHVPYFDLYRKQVVKQADVVLAMHLCDDEFDAEQKRRNFDYYEAITVRDSSLSSVTQAVLAAEIGYLELALRYARETAFVDLHDLNSNADDGLHLAAMAGVWTVMVAGFGGLRTSGDELRFAPRLPGSLDHLVLRLRHRDRCLRLTIRHHEATYELREGEPIELLHHGQPLRLDRTPVTMPIEPVPELDEPSQPFGRAPR